MSQQESSLPSHFGAPFLHQGGFRKQANRSPVEITESYYNHTREDLTVVKRNGMIISLPSEDAFGFEEKLGVRVEFRIKTSVVTDIMRQLNTLDEQDDVALHLLRDAISRAKVNHVVGHLTFTLEYPLTLVDLKKYGGTVYYAELDVVISTEDSSTVVPHPHSERGRRNNIATASVSGAETNAFTYSILVVDNHGQYGPRFVNIGGKVYRIVPAPKEDAKDGVYVTSDKPVDGDFLSMGIYTKHMAFDIAESTLGLYRNYDEALSLGDIGTAKREELLRLEHDNSLLQRELNNAKMNQQMVLANHEKEMQALNAVRDREKLEHERTKSVMDISAKKAEEDSERRTRKMKEEFEYRSLDRKDTSEVVKVLPAIILGVGAVAAVLFKIFSK